MKRTVGILSGILAFLSIVFGASLLLLAIGWPISPERFRELVLAARQMPAALILIAAALAFMAIGIIVLYGMIGKYLDRRTSALLEKNALGETAVSFAAISQIADCTLKKRNDVKSFKTKVSAIGSSIRIDVRAVTAPTVSLVDMTHALQNEIHAAILDACGTPVGSVNVTIDQTDLPAKRSESNRTEVVR